MTSDPKLVAVVGPSQEWLDLLVAVDALIELEPFDSFDISIGFACDDVAQARRRLPVSSTQPKRRQKMKREHLIDACEAMLEATLGLSSDELEGLATLFDARRKLFKALRDFR